MLDSFTIHADGSLILFNYSISDFLYEKLTTAELKEKWEKDAKSNEEITSTFVKNGQAYILVTDSVNNSKYIEFQSDGLNGRISFYSAEDEEIVMKMIESIEFY